jgi:ribosomal protein S3AE
MAKEVKKKHWIPITAPKEFNNKIIGETILKEKGLVGRTLKISLYDLLGDMKKQNNNITFIITNIKDNKAETELVNYFISVSHLKRLVRKAKDKIDDSFIAEDKNKIKVKIKPIMLTKRKTSKAILTALRKGSRQVLSEHLKNTDFPNFVRDVISGKIQVKVKQTIRKIYPLSIYDLRIVERVK